MRRATLLLLLALGTPPAVTAEEHNGAATEDPWWSAWLPGLPEIDEGPQVRTRPVPANAEQLQPDRRLTIWGVEEGPARAGVWQPTPDGGSEQLMGTGVPVEFGESGAPRIDGESIRSIESMLEDLGRREGLRLHFIGHADGTPLEGPAGEVYGGAAGLSAFHAEQVASYVRRRLELPPEAVTWEGAGNTRPLADPATADGRQRNQRVEVRAWYRDPRDAERGERYVPAPRTRQVRICRQEPACVIKRRRRDVEVVQLRNPVEPIRFAGPFGELPDGALEPLARRLEQLADAPNLQVRFIGHTDAAALGRLARERFRDALGLSRAYAREVAAIARERLELDEHEVMVDARGAGEPIAPNDSARGRALNRRVEIEIWHDAVDSGTSVSDIRACPADGDMREYLTEPYRPNGEPPLEPVPFADGEPRLTDDWLRRLVRIHDSLDEEGRNPRINFLGHTERELLDRRAALVYGDARGLSEVRARRVMQAVAARTELPEGVLRFEGKGFSEPPEGSSFGLANAPDGRVEAQILIDVPAPVDPDWTTELVEVTRETEPRSPFALAPLRITVDGDPLDPDGMPHTADVQRCTDVALDEARVTLRYDNRSAARRLNVTADPVALAFTDDPATQRVDNRTQFRAHSNYQHFQQRAEVRLFAARDPVRGEPLDVVPLGPDFRADWFAEPDMPRGLKYVLRVYDAQGRFDETAPKRLWLMHSPDSPAPQPTVPADAGGPEAAERAARARLAALDETVIARRGIALDGGTITITGEAVPAGYTPWVLGEPVPIDGERGFVVERLVPRGLHTAEVALLDEGGNGDVYLRDLQMRTDDWYTVGIADLTAGVDDTNGPAELVTQDDQHFDSGFWADGRLAFYTNGFTRSAWEITGSADTREGPLDEIFSNFMDKNPDALFRRLDEDRFQPTFGDDSTTVEDAPTSGKFFVKAEKDRTFGMWGNFEAEILDTELAQIDRGLYGAYAHYESREATGFGERRTQADLFGAEPGTVAAREEFRGTGGSLFFLQHQDIVQGSDRLRVEVRDLESDLVLQVNNLVAGEDYDIDPIQGRILLTSPLPSTADASTLVRAGGSLAGNPVFLVARYEFTPGFEELEEISAGGRVSHWFNDRLQFGVTGQSDEQVGAEQELAGADLTWRQSAGTWVKLEGASTSGVSTTTLLSNDGGFDFEPEERPADDADADAWRIESAADFRDLVQGAEGRGTFYLQQREAGFSGLGQATTRDTDQAGGTLSLPLSDRTSLHSEVDHRAETDGLNTDTVELNVEHRLDPEWRLTSGLRMDERDDDSPVVAETQTQGRRTDVALRADYEPLETDWAVYGFAQATADKTDTREDNQRLGAGGEMQLTDRLWAEGELSGGSDGTGARVGSSYLYSEATRLYANYTLDNERQPTTGVLERQGSFVSGFRNRRSDSLSIYAEERYAHGDVPTGLTHAFGADKRLATGWTLGFSLEAGTLEDHRTGAETERRAFGLSTGHTGEALDYRGALELRTDETETSDRETFLLKNNMRYKLSESSRLVGKLNLSRSDSSAGEFFDGEFVEAVAGYGLRPIGHDRWNALFKYTYFFNLPAPEQEIADGAGSEFVQRSHILSADGVYEISRDWSLGAKFAFRQGELALSREDPDFFKSRARLGVLRADWHVVHRWDLVLEGRRLELIDAEDTRDGILLGAYRHFGNHVKIGLGYNFTDFSDDLTDLDFDSQGAFINVIAKY